MEITEIKKHLAPVHEGLQPPSAKHRLLTTGIPGCFWQPQHATELRKARDKVLATRAKPELCPTSFWRLQGCREPPASQSGAFSNCWVPPQPRHGPEGKMPLSQWRGPEVVSTQAPPAARGGHAAPRQLPVSRCPWGVRGHELPCRLAAAWKTKQKIAASGEGTALGRCRVRNSRD